MRVIAHRGAGVHAPENTATALRHALSLGVDGVELDIWPTRDRGFVLFHDADLGRLTGRSGWTAYLSQAEIQELETGSRFGSEFSGERVLSLPQALELVQGRMEVVLELKRTRHDPEAFSWIEERLAGMLKEAGALASTLVVSFDHRTLLRMREVAPEVRVGMLYAGEWLTLWKEVELLAPEALLPHWAQTTPKLIREAVERGLSVYPWVVNHLDLVARLRDEGADGIITDYPGRCLELLDRQLDRQPDLDEQQTSEVNGNATFS